MIWYLLSPFRGTSKPPTLTDDHPIRRAFYRHGIFTAQHWLASMLVSCAIAAALAYPTVFLSGNPTAGFTSKPHQIWAAARIVEDGENLDANIEMRQIWVHGTYMKALDKATLQGALRVQQTLVGDEDLTAVATPVSWGFHSPLMYWNNSADAITRDEDVAKTINDQAGSASSLEVSLRPASVFAGKTFSQRKLVAADALVLTLMNRADEKVGRKWQQKMQSLGEDSCPGCQLYPAHGEVSRSWLYEFTFTPVTIRENTALAFAYGCAALYVLLSLRRLKAFHSRVGLVVTAITQMIMSILASFTICGVLKVNLIAVPRNAYPFVLLVISIESMFRLINAILAYPPTMATDLRIANALGDVGPLSIATAAQNLITLWLLSRVVSPGIAAFCTFAAVAVLVDNFFLLTFFVAVLNVDIRRLELQDSISRSKETAARQTSPPRQRSWFDALIYGGLPLSTRMAGSVVTTTFILTLNYFFFERTERRVSLRHIVGLVRGTTPGPMDFDTLAPPPMNATLTPGQWIRMQDFDTAQEVMRLVNDGAQSFVIRVFQPLIIVLSGSDRMGVRQTVQAWGNDLRAFALHHLYPFVTVVIFIVTFVAVLMNFLLWNGAPEISEDMSARAGEAITIEHISTTHKLDIIKISCSRGNIASVALDRSVVVSTLDRSTGKRTSERLSSQLLSVLRWPVHNIAIDDTGDYLAFHTGNDDVVLCNRQTNTVEHVFTYPDHQPSVLFEFVSTKGVRYETCLVVLTAGGQVVLQAISAEAINASLRQSHVLNAQLIRDAAAGIRLVALDEYGQLDCYEISADGLQFLSTQAGSTWLDPETKLKPAGMHSRVLDAKTELRIWTAGRLAVLSIPDLHVLQTADLKTASQYIISNEADKYTGIAEEQDPAKLVLYTAPISIVDTQTLDPDTSEKPVDTTSTSIDRPGVWTTLPHDTLIGLRRKPVYSSPLCNEAQLRRRRMSRRSEKQDYPRSDIWEAYCWTLGDLCSIEFDAALPMELGAEPSLFVTKAGPVATLDENSAIFAFGNCLKIVRTARTRPQRTGELDRQSSTSRKRAGPRSKVQ